MQCILNEIENFHFVFLNYYMITCNPFTHVHHVFISGSYKRILVMISHSQDFLNGVCTNIIHMHKQKLVYYGVRPVNLTFH